MKDKELKLSGLAQPIIVLIVLVILLSLLSPNFLTVDNLMNVLRQVSINGMIAAGLTLVILTGGIDLSVGSILAFSGAIMSMLMKTGINFYLALLVGFAIGLLFGFINGVIITKAGVQPFIGTLVTMMFLRGGTLVLTQGKPIAVAREGVSGLFRWLGRGSVVGIPVPIIITIVLYLFLYYVLTQTKFGRHLYAVGGNEKAAKLSGINTTKTKTMSYIISGITAFLAGVVVTSRLSSAQPTAGEGYEMDAIAAVVLGGTSMAGGIGSIVGTFIGVLIIGVLNNALNLMNVQSYYQQIAKAIIILIAVLLDRKKKD